MLKAILEHFIRSNLNIFFNHGEAMDIHEIMFKAILEYFILSNFKIFFDHGEAMDIHEVMLLKQF